MERTDRFHGAHRRLRSSGLSAPSSAWSRRAPATGRSRARFRAEMARDREEMEQQADRERREMNKRWGELANKMGTVVEDIVAPSIQRLARAVFDCGEPQFFGTRVSLSRGDDRSRRREFDALYVGTRAVLLNETKSSPRASDARRFAAFLESGEFARYFPQYRKLPIVAAFSSLSIPDDLVTYLTRRGIYAIAMGDEAMQVLNLDAVRSRTRRTIRADMNMNYTIDTVEDLVRILEEIAEQTKRFQAATEQRVRSHGPNSVSIAWISAWDVWKPVSTALSTTLDRSRAPTPEMSPSRKRA